MPNIICRPFITLRNGRVLWAHEVGKTAFCFPASPGYLKRKKQKEKLKKMEELKEADTKQKELDKTNS